MGKTLRAVWLVVRMAFRADRAASLRVIGAYVVMAVGYTLVPFWFKLVADSAIARDATEAVGAAAVAALTLTLVVFVGTLGENASQELQERTGLLIDERLARLALGIPGIEHYEHPRYQDYMVLLRQDRGMLSQALSSLMNVGAMVLGITLTAALLARVHPLLLLLPAFGAAFLLTGRVGQRLRQEANEATAERFRQASYLFELATEPEAGKELRVFGLERELVARHDGLWRGVSRERTVAGTRAALLDALAWLVFALGYGGGVGFVVWLATSGRATPGDVLLTLGLASQVYGYVGNFTYLLGWVLSTVRAVERLVWLEEYSRETLPALPVAARAPVPERLVRGIEFEDVSFRYPGTEVWGLREMSLHLPAGSTVALVGENGAGKTTLVKLLTRMYDPTEGSIAVDGADLRGFDVEEWRSRVSAGFQDFARFELLARETVGVGDVPRIESADAVGAALGRAGAGELPGTLRDGLETQLGSEWGGVELSGGQWQKLALGRAMMRARPLLLVLDEPTASLDAETEHALFERYAEATRVTGAESGAITLLVSHRFSTVRMADLIVVLEGGRVTEVGAHEQLVARGGLYAELYELQARGYR